MSYKPATANWQKCDWRKRLVLSSTNHVVGLVRDHRENLLKRVWWWLCKALVKPTELSWQSKLHWWIECKLFNRSINHAPNACVLQVAEGQAKREHLVRVSKEGDKRYWPCRPYIQVLENLTLPSIKNKLSMLPSTSKSTSWVVWWCSSSWFSFRIESLNLLIRIYTL